MPNGAPAIFAEAQTRQFTDYVLPLLTEDEENIGRTLRELEVPPLKVVRCRPKTWSLSMGLDLWACVRILSWEREGVELHRKAGLPFQKEELRAIVLGIWREAVKLESTVVFGELAERVYRLMLDHFAWAGPCEFQAEIELDVPDDDALVNAVANFLWERRGSHVADEA